MGNYLNEPNIKKYIIDGENNWIKFGISSMQGWRLKMEDQFLYYINEKDYMFIFGVFDGHQGDEVAKFLKLKFIYFLKKNQNFINKKIDIALRETFLKIDEMLFSLPGQKLLKDIKNEDKNSFGGSTAIIVIIYKNKIYSACIGDSKCMLYSKDKIMKMNVEHNTHNLKEKNRIIKNGGFIENNRVLGKINITRSFGDFEFKKNPKFSLKDQMITSYPDIIIKNIEKSDHFLILGTDGVWEFLSPKDIVSIINLNINNKNLNLSKIGSFILDKSLAPTTDKKYGKDNMTIIIIELKPLIKNIFS